MVGLIVTLSLIVAGFWAGDPANAAEPPPAADAVVATVDGEPIFAREVQRLEEKAARGKSVSPAAEHVLQAELLEEIVNRRLALAAARRTGEAASEKEVEQALADLKSQLAGQRKAIADFLKVRSISGEELRRQLAWNIYWEKSVAKYVTPERMQKYFDAHRREFDGTELSVSHILLAPSAQEKANGKDDLMARAESLRQDLLAGRISFAEAAKKYSAGPSRDDAGKLGLIGRHGPMGGDFSRAAFALNPGEISPPVRSSFGVHLIRCDEIRPGKKPLGDTEPELRDALARELLEKTAQDERPRTVVEYSDKFPHRIEPRR